VSQISENLAEGCNVMVAYWIARAKVNNPDNYKKYTDGVGAVVAQFNGKVLARGGPFQIMEGPETFHRFVVIEYPDLETAVAAYESPDYQTIRQHRVGGAGEVEIVMVDGVETGAS